MIIILMKYDADYKKKYREKKNGENLSSFGRSRRKEAKQKVTIEKKSQNKASWKYCFYLWFVFENNECQSRSNLCRFTNISFMQFSGHCFGYQWCEQKKNCLYQMTVALFLNRYIWWVLNCDAGLRISSNGNGCFKHRYCFIFNVA